jgi:hypothetical protein
LLLVKASASAGILEANEWTAQTGTGRVRAWRDVSDDGSGYARVRAAAVAVSLAAVIVPTSAVAAREAQSGPNLKCTGDAVTATAFEVPVDLTGQYVTNPGPTTAHGFYIAPKGQPQGLVVFSHGHGASPYDWFAQMQRVAQNDGVIALAMYYPGETWTDPNPKTTYGWRAREGAQGGIAGAMAFLQTCPKLQLRTIVNYGSAWATTPPA